MITTTNMVLAQHFADAYYVNGYAFEPTGEDSDLAEMLSLIPEETLAEMADQHKANEIHDQLHPLDSILDTVSERWMEALTKLITVLEETVSPVYVEYLESVKEQIDTVAPPSDAMLYSINVIDTPTWFLNDPTWFKDNNRGTIPSFKAMPSLLYDPLSDKAITDDIALVISRYDTSSWFCKIRHQSLKATAAVFDGTGSSDYLTAIYAGQDVFTRINDAVLTILLTRVMEHSPPPSLTVDTSKYVLYLRNVRLLAQATITRALPLIRMYENNKTLIASTSLTDKVINVVGAVYYNHYVPGGGTTDALLGRLISSDVSKNSSDILGKIDKYTELWMSFAANSKVTSAHAHVIQLKRGMRRLVNWQRVTEYEENTSGGELSAGDPLPSYIKDAMFREIDTFTLKDLNTIDMFIAKIVGKGRFIGIGAYDFLTDMIYAAISFPGTTAKTATYVAVKNHIARYLATKINVVKVAGGV